MNRLILMLALVAAPLAAAAVPELSEPQLTGLSVSADWQDRQRAALERAWQVDPVAAEALRVQTPGTTRAGGPRFVLGARGPDVTAVLLDRFLAAGDAPVVRVALLDALARTEGEWAPGVAAAFVGEESADVREVMVEVMRRQDPALSQPLLRTGAKDASPAVRSAAARGMGWTEDRMWSRALQEALGDSDASVRADAARALGWVGATDAWPALVAGLADPEPTVRLKAIRALQRLDADRIASEPAVQARVSDPDPKVSRAALQATGG